MIRVAVVRDEGYFGVPVRVLLESKPDLHYVGTLPFAGDLAQRAAELWPTVIVIDTEYMVSQVLPMAAELHATIPSCAMLLLCDPAKRGMLPPRRWAGALNFLLKDVSGAVLADSVRRLAAGERVVSPLLQAASLNTDRGLSTRELEVLGLAAEGESVNDIAGRLYLSGGTVRNYLSAVITKTGARRLVTAWIAGWYAVAVIGATLLPLHLAWGPGAGPPELYRIILIPLTTMRVDDFLLNIVMTLPLAALLYLVAGLRERRRVVLTGFLVSLTIEIVQAVICLAWHGNRWADVNDLTANTLGTWLGFLIFWRAMGSARVRELVRDWSLVDAGPAVSPVHRPATRS